LNDQPEQEGAFRIHLDRLATSGRLIIFACYTYLHGETAFRISSENSVSILRPISDAFGISPMRIGSSLVAW